MPEHQPRKSSTFPSPFHLALLLLAIAVGTLGIGLLSFGALGNFFAPLSVIKQAQAIEAPTSETVEPTTEVPTSDSAATLESTATLEPSATLVVTETVTLEPSPTLTETETPTDEPTAVATTEPTLLPTETVVVETPTVSVEPTQTEIPATEMPQVTPTNTLEPSPTFALATETPLAGYGIILFESEGNLFMQDVDSQGKALDGARIVETGKSAVENIADIILSPDEKRALLFVQTSDKEGEKLEVLSLSTGATQPLFGGEQLGMGTKIFGWHSNSLEIIYWDGESIWLVDASSGDKRLLTNPQIWDNLPYPPLVDSVAFSPDGKQLIASYSTSGQDGHAVMLNADGSNPRTLFKQDYRISAFSWSPDGNLFAFVGDGVEIMDREGTTRKRIGERFIGGKVPAWSPDNRHIAYTADFHPNYKINIVDVETGQQNYIGDDTISAVLPDWSPDGGSIVFLYDWSDGRGAKAIWVARPDGNDLHPFNTDDQPKRIMPLWISQ